MSEFDTQQIDADSDVDDTILDHNDGSLPFHRLTNMDGTTQNDSDVDDTTQKVLQSNQ